MQLEVRTRFAPSPSGFLHVGGARTALFNYLYAKAKGGKFILRVEDTDQSRSTTESFRTIIESLKWLGITWDEGPEVGGTLGPYIQSERLDIYKSYTQKLLEDGKAYRCFCTPEELEAKKKQSDSMNTSSIYDGTCANLTESEILNKIEAGSSYSIRFRTVPKQIVVEDIIQKKVKFDTKLIGDFIIVKSDGFPSYNYAVVIDDHLMKISHVIRGVGHLSNTPRQILIYEAFDFPVPEFAHVSEIVGTDGKKLSKRAGATSILAFRDLGYMSECFVNYMSLLGWTAEDEQEFLPDGMIEKIFSIEKCSKSPAMFDVFKKQKNEDEVQSDFNSLTTEKLAEHLNPKSKLNWLSNKYIRHISIENLAALVVPFIQTEKGIPNHIKNSESSELRSILISIRVYLDRLSQAGAYISEFYNNDISPENEDAIAMVQNGNGVAVVTTFYSLLQQEVPKDPEGFKAVIDKTGELTNEKGKNLFMPIRVFTTGNLHGLELPVLFTLLGIDKLKQRMDAMAKKLDIEVG
jgi:glutamyl-tRNA synthetase